MSVIFGIAALIVCLIAWASKECVLQKMALLLLASWSISNVIYGAMSPPKLLVWNAAMDAAFCLTSIRIMIPKRWGLGVSVLSCFLMMLACHTVFLFHPLDDYTPYYTALNIWFAAQLLTIGGGGVVAVVQNGLWDRFASIFVRGHHSHTGGV